MAVAEDGVDYEAIAARPYFKEIYAPDGQRLVSMPYTGGPGSGPLTIGGVHPTDYFAAIPHPDKPECGLATRNCA